VKLFVIAMLLFATSPTWAGEIVGLRGLSLDTASDYKSYSWQLEYNEGLSENFEGSFTYLNEGHLSENHRDGYGIQFRARTAILDRHLSIAAGAGPYLYFNTTPGGNAGAKLDRHGIALLSSLTATWHFDGGFLLQARVNGVTSTNSIDTFTALIGIGWQLDSPQTAKAAPQSPEQPDIRAKNEITLFFGQSNVFNNGKSHSFSAAAEYRRELLRYVKWSASLLYEGENDLIRRRGFATQLWASKSFFNERLSLGVGAGPYLAFDGSHSTEKGGREVHVFPIMTMSAAYRFYPPWGIRFSWNRVLTDYDRDSDIWLGGISYRF